MQTLTVLGPGMFAAVGLCLFFTLLAPALYLTSNFVLIFIGSLGVIVFYLLSFCLQYLFGLPVLLEVKELVITASLSGLLTPLIFGFSDKYLAKV